MKFGDRSEVEWMRKYLSLLFLYLLFLGVANAVALKDVSPTLPEYEAVKFMVSRGIMDADNGYFKGPKIVTKFDLAVYLYNFYKYMVYSSPVKGVSMPQPSTSPEGKKESSVSSKAEKSVKSSTVEERVKVISDQRVDIILSLLKYDPKDNDFERIKELEKKVTALNDFIDSLSKKSKEIPDISSINEKLSSLSGKVDSLKKEMSSIKSDLQKLEDTVSQQKKEIESINMMLQSQEKSISDNRDSLNEMKTSYLELKEKYNELVKKTGVLENKLNTLKYMMASYAAKIDSHENTLINIQYQLSELSDKVKNTFVSTSTVVEAETHLSTPAELEKYLKEVKDISNEMKNIEKLKADLEAKLKELNDVVDEIKGTKGKVDYLMKSVEVLAANQKKFNDSSRNLLILSVFSVVLSITAIIVSVFF